jgi:hypothetical protein
VTQHVGNSSTGSHAPMKFVRNSLWNELPGASGPILYDIAVRAKPDEQRFQQIVCYGVRR